MGRTIIHVPRRYTQREWGGTETVISETSNALRRRGYKVEIMTSMALADVRSETIYSIPVQRFPYTYTRLGLDDTRRALLDKRGGDLYSWGLLRALLTYPEVDVFHAHTTNRVGAMVRLAARMRRRPYVVTIHGGVLDLPKRELAQLASPYKGTLNWGKPLDLLLGRERVLRDADAIICVGADEFRKMQQAFPHKRVVHLPNGVDLNRFARVERHQARQALGLASDEFLVLCVGSFYEQKNQLALLEALRRLRVQHPKLRAKLIGVIYDQAYFQKMNAYLERHEMQEMVTIHTDVRFDDPLLVEAYRAADLFVLPSRYETFGIVVLEAWAAGAPVVCGQVGGMRDFVVDGRNGLFADVDDAEDLARAMARVLDDAELGRRLSAQAAEDVRAYSWDAIAERLDGLYGEVMA